MNCQDHVTLTFDQVNLVKTRQKNDPCHPTDTPCQENQNSIISPRNLGHVSYVVVSNPILLDQRFVEVVMQSTSHFDNNS